MQPMAINIKPPRAPWGNFPDVLIHASESAVKQHPAYKAAKAGDGVAAMALIRDTMNAECNRELAQRLAGQAPNLVSAHAYERNAVNAIPEVFADLLSQALNWPVDHGIYQANVVFHAGADGFSRLARQARFDGAVSPDCDYVLVDDCIGMGGTLANMKGYIESKGGRVLAAVCSLLLTGKPHSAKLTPSPERLSELRGIHGTELEKWWIGRFAHAFDALTESEARYLARTEGSDTVRSRIAAAK